MKNGITNVSPPKIRIILLSKNSSPVFTLYLYEKTKKNSIFMAAANKPTPTKLNNDVVKYR